MPQNTVLAQMAVLISGQTAQFNQALAQSQKQLAVFQKSVTTVGTAIGGYFGTAILFKGLQQGIGIIADFGAQMSEVKAITDATGDEFKKLQDNTLSVAGVSRFTATEIGKLEAEFARLGFTTQEILNATKATIDLATATGEDLAQSTITVGSAIRQFNLPASEAGHLADVMTGAFNRTALALNDFQEAMKFVGPAAAAANLDFEQTSALLGILADSGIKGSQAGTSLRRILSDLAKDGRPLADRLDELAKKGISLANATDDIGRIASTALIVLEKGAGRVDPLTQSFRNLNGEAERTSAIMRDNLKGDFDALGASISKLTLENGGFVNNFLRGITRGLTGIFNGSAFKTNIGEAFGFSSGSGGAETATAKKIFEAFAQGFDSTSEAAKKFRDIQYQAILNAQISQAENERLFANDKEFLDQSRTATEAEIAARRRLIEVAAAYIRTTAEQLPQVNEVHKRTIDIVGDEIKALKDLQGQVAIGDTAAYDKLQKKIDALNLSIVNTEISINKARQAAALASDSQFSITVPKSLKTNGIDTSSIPAIGSAEAINHLQKTREELKKTNDELNKTAGDGIEHLNRSFLNLQTSMVQFGEKLGDLRINVGKIFAELETVIAVGFAKDLGNAFSGVGNFGENLLKAAANFAVQFGELLIATAIASEAFQQSIAAAPEVAIAAGVALVALGTAVSNTLNRGPSTASAGSSVSASRSTYSGISAQAINGQTVTFQLKGQDLFGSLKNYENNFNG